jgi:hypothetical protein
MAVQRDGMAFRCMNCWSPDVHVLGLLYAEDLPQKCFNCGGEFELYPVPMWVCDVILLGAEILSRPDTPPGIVVPRIYGGPKPAA